MLEAELLDCLNGLLSSFIESLEGVQLDVKHILNGSVSLSNVQIKQSVLSELYLPLKLNFNVIKKLNIKISKCSVFIEIESLLLLFTLIPIPEWDKDLYSKLYVQGHLYLLKLLEEKTKKLLNGGLNNSFLTKITNRFSNSLLNLLHIKVSNVHVRIEDDYTNTPGVAFGVKSSLVELIPNVEREDLPPIAQSINEIKSITGLHLKLSNVGIYIDPINPNKNQENDSTSTHSIVTKCIEELNQYNKLHGFDIKLVDLSHYDNTPQLTSYLDYLPEFSQDKLAFCDKFPSLESTEADSNLETDQVLGLNSSNFGGLKLLDSQYISDIETQDGESNDNYDPSQLSDNNDSTIELQNKQITCTQAIKSALIETFDDSKPGIRLDSEDQYVSYGNTWHVDTKREINIPKKKIDEGEVGVWRLIKTPECSEKFEGFMLLTNNDKHQYVNDPNYTDLYLDIYINPTPTSHLDKSLVNLFEFNTNERDNLNSCFTESLIPPTPGSPACIVCIRISDIVLLLNKSKLTELLNFIIFIINFTSWTSDLGEQVVLPSDGSGAVYKQKWVYSIINSNNKEYKNVVDEALTWCKDFESKHPAVLINVLRYNAAYEMIYDNPSPSNLDFFFKNWLISTFRTSVAIDVLIRNACIYFGRRRALMATGKQIHVHSTSSTEFSHQCTEVEVEKLFLYEKIGKKYTVEQILSIDGNNGGIYFGMDSCLAFTNIDDCKLINGKFTRLKAGNSGVSKFISFRNDSPVVIRVPNKKSLKLLSLKSTKKLPYPVVPYDSSFELFILNNSLITVSATIPNNETISVHIDGGILDTISAVLKYDVLKVFIGNSVIFNNQFPIECFIDNSEDSISLNLGRIYVKLTPLHLQQINSAISFYTSGIVASNHTKSQLNSIEDYLNDREFVSNRSFSRIMRVRNIKIALDYIVITFTDYLCISLTGVYINMSHSFKLPNESYYVINKKLEETYKIADSSIKDDSRACKNPIPITMNGGICYVEVRDASDILPLHMMQIYSGGDEVGSFHWLHMRGPFPTKQHIKFAFDGQNIDIKISPIFIMIYSKIFQLLSTDDTIMSYDTNALEVGNCEENITNPLDFIGRSFNVQITLEGIDVYLLIATGTIHTSYANYLRNVRRKILSTKPKPKSRLPGINPDGSFHGRVFDLKAVLERNKTAPDDQLCWPSDSFHFSTKLSINAEISTCIRASLSATNLYLSFIKNIKSKKVKDISPEYILYPIRMDLRLSAIPSPQMMALFLNVDPITISLQSRVINPILQFIDTLNGINKSATQNIGFVDGSNLNYVMNLVQNIVINNDNSNSNKIQMTNKTPFSFYLSIFIDIPLIELYYHKGYITFNLTMEELKGCSLLKPKLRISGEENPMWVIDNLPRITLLMYKNMLEHFDQLHNRELADFKNAFRYNTPNSLLSVEVSAIASVEMACDNFTEMIIEPLNVVSRLVWPKYNSPISATLATSWLNINLDSKIIPKLTEVIKNETFDDPTSSRSARSSNTDNNLNLQLINLLGFDIIIDNDVLLNNASMSFYMRDSKLPKFNVKIEDFAIHSSNLLFRNNYLNILKMNDKHFLIKMIKDSHLKTHVILTISSCLQIVVHKSVHSMVFQLFIHLQNTPKDKDKIPLNGIVNVPLHWMNSDIYISDGNNSYLLINHNKLEMMLVKGQLIEDSKKSFIFGDYTFRPSYTFSTCEGLKLHALEISIGPCMVIKNHLCYTLKISQDQSLNVIPMGETVDFYNFGKYRLNYRDFTSEEIKFNFSNKRNISFHNGVEEIQLLANPEHETPYNTQSEGHIRSRVFPGHTLVKIEAFAWVINWLNYPFVLRSQFINTFVPSKSITMLTDEMRNCSVTLQIGIPDIKRIENIDCWPLNTSKIDKIFNSLKSPDGACCNSFYIKPEELVLNAKATHINPKLSYACSVRYAPFPYNYTMILQILPKFILHSQIDVPIILSQRNFDCTDCRGCDSCKPTSSDLIINPGDQIEIHPHQKWQSNIGSFFENLHKSLLMDEGINIRLSLGAGYSPKINISSFCRTQLTLDSVEENDDIVRSTKSIQVQVSSVNMMQIDGSDKKMDSHLELLNNISESRLIEILPTQVPLWTIINLSKFELLIAQFKIEKWILLPPNKPADSKSARNLVEFNWFNPQGSKKMELAISGTNKKITIDLKNRARGRFSKAVTLKPSELKRTYSGIYPSNSNYPNNGNNPANTNKIKIILSIDIRLINDRRCVFIDANISEDDIEAKRKNLDLVINNRILSPPFRFHVQILGAGFSYSIDGSELLYASATLAKFSASRNLKKRNLWAIIASLGWFQVDMHDNLAAFKTLILPLPDFCRKSNNSESAKNNVLYLETIFVEPGANYIEINTIKLYVVPLVINIDARFIRLLLLQFSNGNTTSNEVTASLPATPRNLMNMSSIQSVTLPVKPQNCLNASDCIVYIGNIEFGRLIFIINTKAYDRSLTGSIKFFEGTIFNWLLSNLLRTIQSLLYISDATFEFSPLNLSNVSGPFNTLLTMIFNRYTYRGIRQFYNVLGAVDLIGNPKSVLRHFSTGALRCVRSVRTASTVLHLPQIWIPIMLSAARSIAESFIAGLFESIYRLTTSWRQLFQSLANNWIPSPIQPCNLPSDNIWMGLRCGLEKTIKCFGQSLWNFTFKPNEVFKYTRDRSFWKRTMYIFKSCISSINSLVFGTIATTLTLPSELSKGIVNQMQWVPKISSIRPKKVNSGLFDFDENWSTTIGRSLSRNVKYAVELEQPRICPDSSYHTIYWRQLIMEIHKMAKLSLGWSELDSVNKLIWAEEDSIGIYYCGNIWELKREEISQISLTRLDLKEKGSILQTINGKNPQLYNEKYFIHIRKIKYAHKQKDKDRPFIQPSRIKGIPSQSLISMAGPGSAIVRVFGETLETNTLERSLRVFSTIANSNDL